jgi:hypothetical protein
MINVGAKHIPYFLIYLCFCEIYNSASAALSISPHPRASAFTCMAAHPWARLPCACPRPYVRTWVVVASRSLRGCGLQRPVAARLWLPSLTAFVARRPLGRHYFSVLDRLLFGS